MVLQILGRMNLQILLDTAMGVGFYERIQLSNRFNGLFVTYLYIIIWLIKLLSIIYLEQKEKGRYVIVAFYSLHENNLRKFIKIQFVIR